MRCTANVKSSSRQSQPRLRHARRCPVNRGTSFREDPKLRCLRVSLTVSGVELGVGYRSNVMLRACRRLDGSLRRRQIPQHAMREHFAKMASLLRCPYKPGATDVMTPPLSTQADRLRPPQATSPATQAIKPDETLIFYALEDGEMPAAQQATAPWDLADTSIQLGSTSSRGSRHLVTSCSRPRACGRWSLAMSPGSTGRQCVQASACHASLLESMNPQVTGRTSRTTSVQHVKTDLTAVQQRPALKLKLPSLLPASIRKPRHPAQLQCSVGFISLLSMAERSGPPEAECPLLAAASSQNHWRIVSKLQ